MDAIKYTLFVGGGTIDSVEPILTKHGVNGATMTPVHGLWEGKLEYGTKIEIIEIGPHNSNAIGSAVVELKEVLKQDCILMTVETLQAKLL